MLDHIFSSITPILGKFVIRLKVHNLLYLTILVCALVKIDPVCPKYSESKILMIGLGIWLLALQS